MRFPPLALAVFAAASASLLHAELPSETAILKKGGPEAQMIIGKARDILATTQVFASRVVGDPAVPTASCWALTVIVRHDPKAKDFLNSLFESPAFPEQRLYAIAGLLALDPAEKKRFSPEELGKLPDQTVQTQFGRSSMESDLVASSYMLFTQGTAYYFFPDLPPLYSTITVLRPAKTKK